jgi:hypothetical protein
MDRSLKGSGLASAGDEVAAENLILGGAAASAL